MLQILILVAVAIMGGAIGAVAMRTNNKKSSAAHKKEAEEIVSAAKKDAENVRRQLEIERKETMYKMRVDFDNETKARKSELDEFDKRLTGREENLEKRLDFITKKEQELSVKSKELEDGAKNIEKKNLELNTVLAEEKQTLQRVSNMTESEARDHLLKRVDEELVREKATRLRSFEENLKLDEEKKAQELLALAIQRCAIDHSQESTVSSVQLPGDDMKGRIIGREGRNIRTFEQVTGVDVIIDDTPDAVTLSGFDPVRREIAKKTLEKLIADGRIHPARIEETHAKIAVEFEKHLTEVGKNAAFDLEMHNLHPELFKLLGRLKYRTSFGQNALIHSTEVAYLMNVLASEMGLNAKIAKRVGLLHDIGKAVDQQQEGTHAMLGAELAKRYGEKDIVINAIAAHHEEEEPQSLYATLAVVADAISASRPGARKETLQTYVNRLQELEAIANSFKQVEKSFAIQAGREVRVLVKPQEADDDACTVLAREIKTKVEAEMDYPGQIKVTVIRETRAVDIAK
jgi:ribonuclease Y